MSIAAKWLTVAWVVTVLGVCAAASFDNYIKAVYPKPAECACAVRP